MLTVFPSVGVAEAFRMELKNHTSKIVILVSFISNFRKYFLYR